MINFLRKYSLWLLLVLFVVQLAVPASMIWQQQNTLKNGTLYKFETRPIDPYDPFRGKYVTLSFTLEQDYYAIEHQFGKRLQRISNAYAILATDDKGFAKIAKVQLIKPDSEVDYVKVKTGYGSAKNGYRIRLPFNRYYANEETAPAIENAVFRRNEKVEDVYVDVRILKGNATIEELFVNQMPIDEYLLSQDNDQ